LGGLLNTLCIPSTIPSKFLTSNINDKKQALQCDKIEKLVGGGGDSEKETQRFIHSMLLIRQTLWYRPRIPSHFSSQTCCQFILSLISQKRKKAEINNSSRFHTKITTQKTKP